MPAHLDHQACGSGGQRTVAPCALGLRGLLEVSEVSPEELAQFYPKLGNALKQRFAGWRCYVFTADLRLPKLIRLEASRRIPLWNGALECRLYEFQIVAGSHRRPKASQAGLPPVTRGP